MSLPANGRILLMTEPCTTKTRKIRSKSRGVPSCIYRVKSMSIDRWFVYSIIVLLFHFKEMSKTYKYCQSCGMPMKYDTEDGGTEADGAESTLYCSYCYKNGEFTMDATAEEMQAFCTEQKRKMGMPRLFAWLTSLCIPRLQRWKNAPPPVKPAPKYDAVLIAVKNMAVSKKF